MGFLPLSISPCAQPLLHETDFMARRRLLFGSVLHVFPTLSAPRSRSSSSPRTPYGNSHHAGKSHCYGTQREVIEGMDDDLVQAIQQELDVDARDGQLGGQGGVAHAELRMVP